MELILVSLLFGAALIFFIWGTLISSVKHVGAGGIFLSLAFILFVMFKIV